MVATLAQPTSYPAIGSTAQRLIITAYGYTAKALTLSSTIEPFVDSTGEEVALDVSPTLFADPHVRRCTRLVALTLQQPEEIWYEWSEVLLAGILTRFVPDGWGVVRRYIARYQVDDELIAITVLTTIGSKGWIPREVALGEAAMEAARRGWLAYRQH